MIRQFLSFCLCLLASATLAQKPDFIRTPNGPNTIVDWNLKAKTLVLPHGTTLGLFGSQDTTGNVFVRVATGDTSLYFRVGGLKWVKSGSTASTGISTRIIAGTTATPLIIAYSGSPHPNYVLINTATNLIDNNTNVQYDGANFTLIGADNGTGHWADSAIFVIKP